MIQSPYVTRNTNLSMLLRNQLDADVVAANICEKIKELSESMSMSRQLSVGQDDRVVHAVGSPRFYD